MAAATLEGALLALLILGHGSGAGWLGLLIVALAGATTALAAATVGAGGRGLRLAAPGERVGRVFRWALATGLLLVPLAIVGGHAARAIARLAESSIFAPWH